MRQVMPRCPWTSRDDTRLQQLRDSGHKQDEIAEALGKTPRAIRKRMQQLGLGAMRKITALAPWTPEEDKKLAALWEEGKSTAAIGALLGRSKNSIIGRAHRLKLPEHKHASTAIPAVRKPVKKHVVPALPTVVRAPTPAYFYKPKPDCGAVSKQHVGVYTYPKPAHFKGVTLMDLENNSCRYPYENDRGTMEFCGQQRKPDSSYCPGCHSICWTNDKD